MAGKKKRRTAFVKQANSWEDHYTRLAKKENYLARSVYKLKEIQAKFKVLARGQRVVDLGCAPGSWLQYVAESIGPEGRAMGLDLKAVDFSFPSNIELFTGDICEPDLSVKNWLSSGADCVLSDMAPSTTGAGDLDALRSLALAETALAFASENLLSGGNFVCKVFQGRGFEDFHKEASRFFDKTRLFKPESCRKKSREIYLIGLDFLKK